MSERDGDVTVFGRLLVAGAGAVAARYALRVIRTAPPAPALERTNFRGRT